jgi:hypothetical protein
MSAEDDEDQRWLDIVIRKSRGAASGCSTSSRSLARSSIPPAVGARSSPWKQDFCWLVFDHGHEGPTVVLWLNREGTSGPLKGVL